MKLAALFAKYLYQNKELKLPGIGVFLIDPSVPVPDPSDKHFTEFTRQIRYEPTRVSAPDESFVNFIRTETGKIKPLAESDIDTFLSDGKILLNIGKPFFIEGIGSICKTRTGQFEFVPGEPFTQKLESYGEAPPEDSISKRSVFNDDYSKGSGIRKLAIVLGVIGGLALVIWGGYSLYNRNTSRQQVTQSATLQAEPETAQPTRQETLLDSVQSKIDSVRSVETAAHRASANASDAGGTYRFIIEKTPRKSRALRRYTQLKDNLSDIRMDTKSDSSEFTLYFVLPAQPADTARIRDSLKWWYGRNQVWIEKLR